MKQIIPTTQYKKDLKRYANQRKKMEALLEILRCLANEEPIPENCQSISNAYQNTFYLSAVGSRTVPADELYKFFRADVSVGF